MKKIAAIALTCSSVRSHGRSLAKDLPPVPKPAPETILEQMPVGGKK